MAVTVPRHGSAGPDDEGYARTLGEAAGRAVGTLEENPRWFNSAMNQSLMYLQARVLVDPRGEVLATWQATVSAMQVGSALYASAAAEPDTTVECRIDAKMRTIPAAGPATASASAGHWLTAFWLAVVCRDRERLRRLAEFPVERMREAEGEFDEYVYLWVDALQAFWLRRPDLVDKLRATIEATHPDRVRIVAPDALNQLMYPPIDLLRRYLTRDHAGFNQALVEALELHKAYWTADDDRATDVEGSLALAPLALACLAYDADFPIDVESDYLPVELLHRSWLGEFPT